MNNDKKYSAYLENLGEGRRFLFYSAAALFVQVALILPFLLLYSHIRSIPQPIRIDLYSNKLELSDPIQALTTFQSAIHQKDFDRYFASVTPEYKQSIENVLKQTKWSLDRFFDWQYHSLRVYKVELYGTAPLDDALIVFEIFHTLHQGNLRLASRWEKIEGKWYSTHRLAGDPRYLDWIVEWRDKGERSAVINRLLGKE